jgi:hypothetical protein
MVVENSLQISTFYMRIQNDGLVDKWGIGFEKP